MVASGSSVGYALVQAKNAYVSCVQMLYADIFIASCVYCLCVMGFEGILADTPKLKAHMERVKVRALYLLTLRDALRIDRHCQASRST